MAAGRAVRPAPWRWSRLARFDPGAPVGNGGQLAAPDTAEEAAV
jgi:hypothetical protein